MPGKPDATEFEAEYLLSLALHNQLHSLRLRSQAPLPPPSSEEDLARYTEDSLIALTHSFPNQSPEGLLGSLAALAGLESLVQLHHAMKTIDAAAAVLRTAQLKRLQNGGARSRWHSLPARDHLERALDNFYSLLKAQQEDPADSHALLEHAGDTANYLVFAYAQTYLRPLDATTPSDLSTSTPTREAVTHQ